MIVTPKNVKLVELGWVISSFKVKIEAFKLKRMVVIVFAETKDKQGLIDRIILDIDRILTPKLKFENYTLPYHRSYHRL